MADALVRLPTPYVPVLTVHDEIVTEAILDSGDVADLCDRMCRVQPWAEGIPLAAAGWAGKRYRK